MSLNSIRNFTIAVFISVSVYKTKSHSLLLHSRSFLSDTQSSNSSNRRTTCHIATGEHLAKLPLPSTNLTASPIHFFSLSLSSPISQSLTISIQFRFISFPLFFFGYHVMLDTFFFFKVCTYFWIGFLGRGKSWEKLKPFKI